MRTVKIFEIGELNTLAHAENIGCCAEAVDQHPDVACVESGDLFGGFDAGSTVGLQSVLDISPRCNNGAENHQSEREEGHGSDASTEP